MNKEALLSLLNPLIEKEGYILSDIVFTKENGSNILRVLIDKEEGSLSLDEIIKISEIISPALDEVEFLSESYFLDVCSLGAEKEIDVNKLEKYLNKNINIHLTHPYEGENYLEGKLVDLDDDEVTLEVKIKSRKKNIVISRRFIDKARLALDF